MSFVEKGVLKNFANFSGKHLCWSLFLIKLQAQETANFLKRDSNTVKFLKLFRKKYLRTSAFVFSPFILFAMHEKYTANEA